MAIGYLFLNKRYTRLQVVCIPLPKHATLLVSFNIVYSAQLSL